MKLAVMQPYLFPYLGYFQLIHAVDTFVFYDDVHFIKGGWINRNRLILNKEPHYFTIPLHKQSSFTLIKNTLINNRLYEKWKTKFLKSVKQNYSKAPYFDPVYRLIEQIFISDYESISTLAIASVTRVCKYLDIDTSFEISSQKYGHTIGYEKADRLIAIAKEKDYSEYINPAGGKTLYDPAYFKSKGVHFSFIDHELLPYPQFSDTFVSGLSIIDLLMFNSKTESLQLLNNYKLL